jgi:uncharacterized protein (DUF427 family)
MTQPAVKQPAENKRGRVRTEPGRKLVRAMIGGQVLADTITPLFVWENPYYPAYYVLGEDVNWDLLKRTDRMIHSPSRGDSVVYDLIDGSDVADPAGLFEESPIDALVGHVRIAWDAVDTWFEEDEQVYVHPRNPYARIDALPSSRNVRIEVDGTVVAESSSPVILFETGLPPRYYLPKVDVRLDLLSTSETTSRCPYKGMAEYYDVTVDGTTHDDLVWWYRTPVAESAPIVGRVCFYDEVVDVFIDDEIQPRPKTHFA